MADSKMWRGLKPNKAKKVFELNPSVLEATKEFGKVHAKGLWCLQLVYSCLEDPAAILMVVTNNHPLKSHVTYRYGFHTSAYAFSTKRGDNSGA